MTHPRVFAMLSIASALRIYAKTKIKVNRAYTPMAMMTSARIYTGKNFLPRDYVAAAEALEASAIELNRRDVA